MVALAASRISTSRGPRTVLLLVEIAQSAFVASEQSLVPGIALSRDCLLAARAADGVALPKDAAVCGALRLGAGAHGFAVGACSCGAIGACPVDSLLSWCAANPACIVFCALGFVADADCAVTAKGGWRQQTTQDSLNAAEHDEQGLKRVHIDCRRERRVVYGKTSAVLKIQRCFQTCEFVALDGRSRQDYIFMGRQVTQPHWRNQATENARNKVPILESYPRLSFNTTIHVLDISAGTA